MLPGGGPTFFSSISGNAALAGFSNLQSFYYWSGTEYAPDTSGAWAFNTNNGLQYTYNKADALYALAVLPGDVAAIPEPETYAMMLAGLGLIGLMRRRRR